MLDNVIETYKNCDSLFGKIYLFNQALMDKSEDKNHKPTPLEIFDFYITSNALPLLKNICIGPLTTTSVGSMIHARCVLEGLALKRYFQSADAKEINGELLDKQLFITEYWCYKNIMSNFENCFVPGKVEKDFEETKSYYFKRLENLYSKEQIRAFLSSSLPFTLLEKTNFKEFVNKYVGKEAAAIYATLSYYSHPGTNTFYKEKDLVSLALYVCELIEKEYSKLTKWHSCSEWAKLLRSPISDELLYLCDQEKRLINSVADVVEKHFGNNYVSNTFNTIAYLIPDLGMDKIMGLIESVKIKWKTIFEIFSTFDNLYYGSMGDQRFYNLLDIHKDYQFDKNLGGSGKEYLEEAYLIFSKLHKNPCSLKTFEEGFSKIDGYLITENGHCRRMVEIVNDFSKVYPLNWAESAIMNYRESQMLSHANGYMWNANSGAFNDSNPIFALVDMSVEYLFNKMLVLFTSQKDDPLYKTYKPIVNILRNTLKELIPIFNQKSELLKIPTVGLQGADFLEKI